MEASKFEWEKDLEETQEGTMHGICQQQFPLLYEPHLEETWLAQNAYEYYVLPINNTQQPANLEEESTAWSYLRGHEVARVKWPIKWRVEIKGWSCLQFWPTLD